MTDFHLRAARRALILFTLMAAGLPRAIAAPVGPVRYEVSVAGLAERKFRVAITVPIKQTTNESSEPKESSVSFAIPAWSPGYYQILNFQKDISNFRAVDDKGKTLKVTRPEERTWAVMGVQGAIHATYDVSAKDAGFGFFASHLDDKTGYINGASALMYVVGGKQLSATIAYRVPTDWKLATSLDPDDKTAEPGNAFKAADYDELIDCPAQMGKFERLDFTVKSTRFSAVVVGADKVDEAAMTDVLSRISEAGINVFGYPPFKRYIYFIHCSMGSFGGGLEHRNSTVLNVWKAVAEDPRSITDLAAHEFFHAWNVKRLHPAVLGPFDYTQKVRTGALWFAEGVTDYYANVLPLMAGFTKESEFRGEMANRIRQLQHTDARLRISAEEASQKSWEGGSMGFGGLSYYLKGSLIGLLLDVKIRSATDNAKNLDDVMRLLDERYGKMNTGYEEDALLKAVNEMSGQDMSDFYNRYVRGTEEIPWNMFLRDAGLVYEEGANKIAFLGVSTEPSKNLLVVRQVVSDSAAAKAGVKESDKIVTINGARVKPAEFQGSVAKLKPGQKLTLGIRRGDSALELPVTLGEREGHYVRLRPLEDADEKAKRVRSGLMREVPSIHGF